MTNVVSALVSLLLASNQVQAASNLVEQATGVSIEAVNPNDPVEQEYQKLLAADDLAHTEIDKWIRDSEAFSAQGAGSPRATLNARIEQRQQELKKQYEAFLARHPRHARARLAFGSLLNDMGEEVAAAEEWEKARELDPKNPAAWNNLANFYGHRSPVKKSFEYYARAIELDPTEKVYYQNFATTVYLFRKDAMDYYEISEQEVFEKALELYRKAMALDPQDFVLYSDYAQSFYGTKPPRYDEGLKAWQETYKIARDDVERQGVLVHMARCRINLGQFEEARHDLAGVTNEMYLTLKTRLQSKLERERSSKDNDPDGNNLTDGAAGKPSVSPETTKKNTDSDKR